jgi:purine-binding chemotaxis protein CheW
VKIARPADDEPLDAQAIDLLERRAARLRERPAQGEEEALLAVAEFSMGEERYAIALTEVRNAMRLHGVTPVPLTPAHVLGILRHEGRIVPVYSFASLLGVRGWRLDPEVLLVVEPRGAPLCAVDVEQIPKATTLSVSVVEQARARAGDEPIVEVTTKDLRRIHLVDRLSTLLDRAGRASGVR